VNPRIKHRRGVASIIGGVFLILIIISAYAFFMMSNNATNDLQTTINNQSSLDEDKNQESLSLNYMVPNPDANGVVIAVVNSGPKTMTINYIGINDVSNNGIYDFSEPSGNANINPGDMSSYNIVPTSNSFQAGHTYRIKLITSKGSIFSFNYPNLIPTTNSLPSISSAPAISSGQPCYILTGSNFASSASITIDVTPGSTGYPMDITALNSGLFSTYFNQLSYGTYSITATDTSHGTTGTTILRVTPYIVLSPNSLQSPDLDFTVKGSGYPKSSTINILFDNSPQATSSTDPSGVFTVNMHLTGISAGSHIVVAEYHGTHPDFLSASNIFTVKP
jgi:hypothetical protein